MPRIKSLEFKNHPIFGSTTFDFCRPSGEPAENIVFAGENGSGKTRLLRLGQHRSFLQSRISSSSRRPKISEKRSRSLLFKLCLLPDGNKLRREKARYRRDERNSRLWNPEGIERYDNFLAENGAPRKRSTFKGKSSFLVYRTLPTFIRNKIDHPEIPGDYDTRQSQNRRKLF